MGERSEVRYAAALSVIARRTCAWCNGGRKDRGPHPLDGCAHVIARRALRLPETTKEARAKLSE